MLCKKVNNVYTFKRRFSKQGGQLYFPFSKSSLIEEAPWVAKQGNSSKGKGLAEQGQKAFGGKSAEKSDRVETSEAGSSNASSTLAGALSVTRLIRIRPHCLISYNFVCSVNCDQRPYF